MTQYDPPPGPPPGRAQETYSPPPGPPPGREEYAPPPGPPPGRTQQGQPANAPPSYEEYAPPSGPPPGYHNWQEAVPDTSLLPPPPSVGYDASSTSNANASDADRGEAWCKVRPLWSPRPAPADLLRALSAGNIKLIKPVEFIGEFKEVGVGHWHGKTKTRNTDSCLMSDIPLYVADAHSPLRSQLSRTIYFEARIARRNRKEVSLALGFVAQPYPTFRMPGWERGSLGVHGDDGHKYVNDRWGGHDFTSPFKPGETVGIGMTFSRREVKKPGGFFGRTETTSTSPINVEIFFTREGRKVGGWNLHEELDAEQDLPVIGLEGHHDLYAAVGTFEDVDFEVLLSEKDWLYKGYNSSV